MINVNEQKPGGKVKLESFGIYSYILVNISKHKWRTILTIIGIAIPIAFFVLFAAMGEGLDRYIIERSENEIINQESYLEMSKIVNAWTDILIMIIAVMIVTSIANTILMSTTERKKEFGILKAVGISQERIIYLVVMEAMFISALALFVGIILGYWGAILFDYMFWLDEGAGFFFAPATITVDSLIIVTVLTILISTITSIYPAISASRGSTIEILRYE